MAEILHPLCCSLAWLHQSLSVMFMVCLLTDKWKSNSQVCKLKVNSGVICQLTIQRNCLQQGESSLTHTDVSCAGHAALQAKCCCKCLCCSFCHSACGSSQQTRGGHGWPRDVTAPICLSAPGRNGGGWWDGQLFLQPIQSMSASLSGPAWDSLPGRHPYHPACVCSRELGSPSRPQGPWLLTCGLLGLCQLPWTSCPCLLTPGVVFETAGGWVWCPGYLQWRLKCVWQLNWPCGSCVSFLGTGFSLMK